MSVATHTIHGNVKLCKCGHIGIYGTDKCTPAGCSDQAPERELKFKQAVLDVIADGEHPSGVRIRRKLGKLRFATDGNLGGMETRWRREVLMTLGWYRPYNTADPTGIRSRWKAPVDCVDQDCENGRLEVTEMAGKRINRLKLIRG